MNYTREVRSFAYDIYLSRLKGKVVGWDGGGDDDGFPAEDLALRVTNTRFPTSCRGDDGSVDRTTNERVCVCVFSRR